MVAVAEEELVGTIALVGVEADLEVEVEGNVEVQVGAERCKLSLLAAYLPSRGANSQASWEVSLH